MLVQQFRGISIQTHFDDEFAKCKWFQSFFMFFFLATFTTSKMDIENCNRIYLCTAVRAIFQIFHSHTVSMEDGATITRGKSDFRKICILKCSSSSCLIWRIKNVQSNISFTVYIGKYSVDLVEIACLLHQMLCISNQLQIPLSEI